MRENRTARKVISDRIRLYESLVEGLEKKRLSAERTKKCAQNLCEKMKNLSQHPIFQQYDLAAQRSELAVLCNRLQTIF